MNTAAMPTIAPEDTSIATAGFNSLGLTAALVAAVAALGYEEPTPIQREAIPVLLAGRDLVGQAATGTGKTAAFALPMLDRIRRDGPSRTGGVRGLVLVPTRELAMQVAEAIQKYAKGVGLSVVAVYGGASMDQQLRSLKRGVDIVVATPGRALDHLRRSTLALDRLQVLVLDEADEMLDMGFAEDLETIMNATPTTRQTALFSATIPARIAAIAKRHLTNPSRVTVAREKSVAGTVPRVRQVGYIVSRAQKSAALGRVLEFERPKSAIVFCRTRHEVDSLTETLTVRGYRAQALHGGMMQRQRDRVMQLFKDGHANLLVATDVAARGLDIEHLSHVINYDVPPAAEGYVHRIGRTGRIGREGVAITLVDPREQRLMRNIEAFTKQRIEIATLPTPADLRLRRLDSTRVALRERLTAGGLDDFRTVVEALAQEFDVRDVAAAAVKMAHEGSAAVVPARSLAPAPAERQDGREGQERRERPARTERAERKERQEGQERPERPERSERSERPAKRPGVWRAGQRQAAEVTRLYIGAGRQAGIGARDLVGAITGEAGIESQGIGAIDIAERFSIVEVPETLADRIIDALRATKLRGQKVDVRRER
jgi:ATP-dependent RNA helicase DeaD